MRLVPKLQLSWFPSSSLGTHNPEALLLTVASPCEAEPTRSRASPDPGSQAGAWGPERSSQAGSLRHARIGVRTPKARLGLPSNFGPRGTQGATLKLVLRVLLAQRKARAERVCPWHPRGPAEVSVLRTAALRPTSAPNCGDAGPHPGWRPPYSGFSPSAAISASASFASAAPSNSADSSNAAASSCLALSACPALYNAIP